MDQFLAQAIKRSIERALQHTDEVTANKTQTGDYAHGYLKGTLLVILEELNKAKQLNK